MPAPLRNHRDRTLRPVSGWQQAAGQFSLTPEQTGGARDRLADIVWCVALLGGETGLALQDVAEHRAAQLQARATELDPDRR